MYKIFAGIASGFTLVSIFSEDTCMQVAATIVVGIMRSFLDPHTVTITHLTGKKN